MRYEMKIKTYDDYGNHVASDYSDLDEAEYRGIMRYLTAKEELEKKLLVKTPIDRQICRVAELNYCKWMGLHCEFADAIGECKSSICYKSTFTCQGV